MSNTNGQACPVIPDTAILRLPEDQMPLVRRIVGLSVHSCFTAWMKIEIASIAILMQAGTVTPMALWQLVLTHYNVAPSVTRQDDNDSGLLAKPLADMALVWEHLTALCAGQPLAPIQTLPEQHDEETPTALTFRDQALDFYTDGLKLLWQRCAINVGDFLGRLEQYPRHDLEHDPRHQIEHYLAVQWFGGPMAVGAALHGRLLAGGSFGLNDEPVYVLKALVMALKQNLADHEDVRTADADSVQRRELLGRVYFWWTLVKGYTYDMVRTQQGRNVVAMLVKHPELVADLKAVLTQGLVVSGKAPIPMWGGGRSDCLLNEAVAQTPIATLIDKLTEQLVSAQAEISQVPRR